MERVAGNFHPPFSMLKKRNKKNTSRDAKTPPGLVVQNPSVMNSIESWLVKNVRIPVIFDSNPQDPKIYIFGPINPQSSTIIHHLRLYIMIKSSNAIAGPGSIIHPSTIDPYFAGVLTPS